MLLKKRVFEIIERAKPSDKASKAFDLLIISLIILNIIAVIISSFSNLTEAITDLLYYFEFISVIIFTIEYFLRIWTAQFLFPNSKWPSIKFSLSFLAIIDLFAILPFYIPFIIPFDLRFLRMLRLLRLFRIFKLNRYNNAMDTIVQVLKNEKEKLITTLFITSILLIFASSIMYYVENEAQPDQFPNIIASIWWAVATLTTVGYGDVYPITAIGKLLSGIIAMLGIGLVALPTGIISSGFINAVSNKKYKTKRKCPHCGQEIDD